VPAIRGYIKDNEARVAIAMLACEQLIFDDAWWEAFGQSDWKKLKSDSAFFGASVFAGRAVLKPRRETPSTSLGDCRQLRRVTLGFLLHIEKKEHDFYRPMLGFIFGYESRRL